MSVIVPLVTLWKNDHFIEILRHRIEKEILHRKFDKDVLNDNFWYYGKISFEVVYVKKNYH